MRPKKGIKEKCSGRHAIPPKTFGIDAFTKSINTRGKRAMGNPRHSLFSFDAFTKRANLTPEQKRLWELEKFLLKFLLLVIPVYLILAFGLSLAPVQLEVARQSDWLMKSMGFNTTLYGAGVVVDFPGKPSFFFTISADCTGWKAMLFFVALVMAVPRRSWKSRTIGVVAGVAAIWAVNLFRVVAVVSTYSSYGYATAMLVHDYLWQLGLGAAALVIWAVWLRTTKTKGR